MPKLFLKRSIFFFLGISSDGLRITNELCKMFLKAALGEEKYSEILP